jgi:hypothetical protein
VTTITGRVLIRRSHSTTHRGFVKIDISQRVSVDAKNAYGLTLISD